MHSLGFEGIVLHVEADQKGQKWELKYEIQSPGDEPGLQIITPTLTLGLSKCVEHLLTI